MNRDEWVTVGVLAAGVALVAWSILMATGVL